MNDPTDILHAAAFARIKSLAGCAFAGRTVYAGYNLKGLVSYVRGVLCGARRAFYSLSYTLLNRHVFPADFINCCNYFRPIVHARIQHLYVLIGPAEIIDHLLTTETPTAATVSQFLG